MDIFITAYGFKRKTLTSSYFSLLFPKTLFFLVHYCVLPLGPHQINLIYAVTEWKIERKAQ